MTRSWLWSLVPLGAIAACNVVDDRPETLAYVTETVLAPSCGLAECHSAMKRQSNYVFDSVAGAQASIAGGHLVATCALPPCENADASSYLLTVISTQDVEGDRMPRDQPLANKDIVYIASWITDGADGYVPPNGSGN
jgi:hypothetical protein